MLILSTVTNRDLMEQLEKIVHTQNSNWFNLILPPLIVGGISLISVFISNYFAYKNMKSQLTHQQEQMKTTLDHNQELAREQYERSQKLQNSKFMNEYSFTKLDELRVALKEYYNKQVDEDLKLAQFVNFLKRDIYEQGVKIEKYQKHQLKLQERSDLLLEKDLFSELECKNLITFGSEKLRALFDELTTAVIGMQVKKYNLITGILDESNSDFKTIDDEIMGIRLNTAVLLTKLNEQLEIEIQELIQQMKG